MHIINRQKLTYREWIVAFQQFPTISAVFSLSLYESIRLSHNNGRAATSAKMLRSNSLFEDIFTADLRIVRSNRAGLLLSVGALTDNLIGRNVKMLASKARNIV